MSGRIVKLNASAHQAAQELLPWYVNATLDNEEYAQVHEHVQACTQCQADIDFQRKLLVLQLPEEARVEVDVERAFARLRPQLKTAPRAARLGVRATLLRSWWRAGARHWMQWALATQMAVIAGLCIMLLPLQREAAYHGLGTAGNAAGNVVVMFKPQTTEQELRRILRTSGARVVDGPTVTDAYLLHVDNGQQTRVLGLLRTESAVVLAESLDRQE